MEFPRLVYKCNDNGFDTNVAKVLSQHSNFIKDGWFDNLADAKKAKKEQDLKAKLAKSAV